MLQCYQSNLMEQLADWLVERLAVPLADPLAPEVILVQNPAMARWLTQRIAETLGIAANLEFPLPASFVWRIQQAWLPELPEPGPYDREGLRWGIMARLPALLPRSEFALLQRYLGTGDAEVRRYQLAGRIANLFDQYLVYRPDLLLGWQRGQLASGHPDEPWQAGLWCALVEQGPGLHRAELFARFRQAVEQCAPSGPLPERVAVFGLSAIAPVQLHALDALARHAKVGLYLLNPCREYWADLVDERGQARRRARWRGGQADASALLEVGNPLLASLGQVGQTLVDQLLELGADTSDQFVAPERTDLLSLVQGDILELRDRRQADPAGREPIDAGDRSIQIHACYSPLREVQVLHDQLRRCFDELPGLEPREVLVMAPDIALYAPYIEAVFGAAEGERRIPWSIADLGSQDDPLSQALDHLLRLPEFRFEASGVLSLLEAPALARRFAIDEDALADIRRWVRETAIRWGLDGPMRAELGLPDEPANTWDAGLERLFLGYARSPDGGLRDGVPAYADIEGAEAEALGQLAALLEVLARWRRELAQPLDATGWVERINRLLAELFRPDSEEESLMQQVRDALGDLRQRCQDAGYAEPLPLSLIRAELAGGRAATPTAGRFLAGGVTCCNMVPMRSIPFRVICLLGMNDGAFPRRDDRLGFDLMHAMPRVGDRSRRLDDRYLFLEALMSARELLYISYLGQGARNNGILAPSVVVSELLDYLALSCRYAADEDFVRALVVRHPLQPFSHRYFDGVDPRLLSYDPGWFAAAAGDREGTEPRFIDGELPAEEGASLELDSLIRFLINPAAWFLRQRLGIRGDETEEALEDEEPFQVDGLVQYDLRTRGLEALLRGEGDQGWRALALATGDLPQGLSGELCLEELGQDLPGLAGRILKHQAPPVDPLELDRELDGVRLSGWLLGVTERGLLSWRGSDLKAKDRVRLWVRHLVLCWFWRGSDRSPQSVHVAKDQTLVLGQVSEPAALLSELLRAWRQGQRVPLAFFPAAALAYVDALAKADDKALERAVKVWEQDYDGGGNNIDVQTAFRGQDPLRDTDFEDWAERLAGPLHQASTLIAASKDQAS